MLLFRAKDEEDVIRIANDSPYGLGGSVFTRNTEHGSEVVQRISTGMVFVNRPTLAKPDLSFGGIRRSGYLPSYLPELNPNELLNAYLKQYATKAARAKTKTALPHTAISTLRRIQKRPERVETTFCKRK
jgi:acyl-CoA reductase-like NAD-dependent aldehyde dehydrogenase